MSSNFDQQVASNSITIYFRKVSSIFDNFVDKHTRETQNKKSIEFEYVFRQKVSTQFKFNQNFVSQISKAKRQKIINIQIFRASDLSDSNL